jgi:hypothetical protein
VTAASALPFEQQSRNFLNELSPEEKAQRAKAAAARIATFRSFGVGEDVLEQVRSGKPVSEQEYTLAQHKKTSLMQDRAWVQKYLDGDQDARRTMAMISIILGSKIKEE